VRGVFENSLFRLKYIKYGGSAWPESGNFLLTIKFMKTMMTFCQRWSVVKWI